MIPKIVNAFNVINKLIPISVGVITSYIIKEYLKNEDFTILNALILSIAILIYSLIIINLFSKFLNWSMIRKIILGKDYIEGQWLQTVEIDNDDKPERKFTLLDISFKSKSYHVHGKTFNNDGEIISIFDSTMTKFIDNTLSYPFKINMIKSDNIDILGNTNLQFSKVNKEHLYIGTVYSNFRSYPVDIRGKKIDDDLSRDLDSESGRKSYIKKLQYD